MKVIVGLSLFIHQEKHLMRIIKKRKGLNLVLLFSLCAVTLVALTFVLPVSNLVVFNEFWAAFWIGLTNIGGTVGVGITILIIAIVWSFTYQGTLKRLLKAFMLIVFLGAVIGATAFLNEHLIKEQLCVHRPSIELLQKEYGFNANEFYQQEGKELRRAYVQDYLKTEGIDIKNDQHQSISNLIKKVWIKEAGYSFPSGHTVTVFLMMSLLSYIFLKYFKRKHVWVVCLLFLWAVIMAYSRVVIGVHTPLDVTFGALWGSLIAGVVISTGFIEILFFEDKTHKKSKHKKRTD